jgi:hypothetical protein
VGRKRKDKGQKQPLEDLYSPDHPRRSALKLRLHLRFRSGYTPRMEDMEDRGDLGGFDWEGADDITALSDGDLRRLLDVLIEEERVASYRLEVLRGRIELIRAERVGRGVATLSPEDLARALLGDSPGGERE